MRQAQRARAQPVAVALAMRAGFGDMAERVGAGVAVGGRILGPADADRIEDDDQHAGHDHATPSFQRALQVGDQIVGILDADRQPHQPVVDAECRAHLRRHRGMGHDGGMLDQAFDAAQAFGQGEQLAALEEALGASSPPLSAA